MTPAFYNPDRIGTLFYPDIAVIAAQAAAAGLNPAAEDTRTAHLLIIHMQVDFCHEKGSLYVPGAREDIRRVIDFIYRHAAQLTDITCSLDSHLPHQIFHPAWWRDADGNSPPPLTVITLDDVDTGRWRAVREPEWSLQYVAQLEERGRCPLVIWPYHVPIGGLGHALDPELWSAVFWHALARSSQPLLWATGHQPGTEHYSILGPEVPRDHELVGAARERLLNRLRSRDLVFVAGEASSHCVLATLEDLVAEFRHEPGQLQRIRVLRDCMSPVPHPEIDYAAITETRFTALEHQGLRFMKSTDPWPVLPGLRPVPGPQSIPSSTLPEN